MTHTDRPRHAAPRARLVSTGFVIAAVAGLGASLVITAAQSARAAEAPVGLGTAESFAVLAGSTVTNTGPSVVTGDLGVSPGTAITGFPPGVVVGGVQHSADAVALQAQQDVTTAYNDAAGRTPATPVASDLGGQTLVGGTYASSAAMALTGTVTLDAQGDAQTVFIFQAGSTLTTATNSSVALVNGAQACNVYWQVGSSATMGTDTTFTGTVMALTSISLQAGTSVDGRLLARTGAVTLDSNTVTRPLCSVAPTPTESGSATPTGTTTPTATATATPSASPTGTASATTTPTATATVIPSASPTATPTVTASAIPTMTASATPTVTASVIPTVTPTMTASATPTVTATVAPTARPTASATITPTSTGSPTATGAAPAASSGGTAGDSSVAIVPAGRPDTGRGATPASAVASTWTALGLIALIGSVLAGRQWSSRPPRGRHLR